MAGAIPAYPDDSLQGIVRPWWEPIDGKDLCRGRLVWVFVPHVEQVPQQLNLTGRTDPTAHGAAEYTIGPLRISDPRTRAKLPVAAMPLPPGDVHAVYRAKARPAVITNAPPPEVPERFRRGVAKWQTAPTLSVAPYYGVDQGGTRGGWRPEFVDRIRLCEYPQYLWDRLPLGGTNESILRLDHIQPVGLHSNACEVTPYCLSKDALAVIDEWLEWLHTGSLPDGVLTMIRTDLLARATLTG